MKIDIVPRIYFEERRGTAEVAALLRSHKVISIQSSNGLGFGTAVFERTSRVEEPPLPRLRRLLRDS